MSQRYGVGKRYYKAFLSSIPFLGGVVYFFEARSSNWQGRLALFFNFRHFIACMNQIARTIVPLKACNYEKMASKRIILLKLALEQTVRIHHDETLSSQHYLGYTCMKCISLCGVQTGLPEWLLGYYKNRADFDIICRQSMGVARMYIFGSRYCTK